MSLPAWVTPGTQFRVTYGDKNPADTVWHVRGIVDGCAVCRRWRSAKQWWHYEVLEPLWFEVMISHISIGRKKS